MYVRVLGSAAGGGFPQWNCNCRNCDGLRKGTIRARARTQSSIAVSADRAGWVLINASPDLPAQFRTFPALQPGRTLRDTAVLAIVLIDAQIDHTTGLLMLREGAALEIYCTDQVREDLTRGNPLFNVLDHYCGVEWHRITPDSRSTFSVAGANGLAFTAVPLKSKPPPYSPHRNAPRPGDNIGLRITDARSGRSLFYAPGLGEIEPQLQPLLAERRLPDGRRHVLDRRRDGQAGDLDQARARHGPPAAERARRHARSAQAACGRRARSSSTSTTPIRSWTRTRPSARRSRPPAIEVATTAWRSSCDEPAAWSRARVRGRAARQAAARYHIHHPFNVALNRGRCTRSRCGAGC